MSEVPPQSLCLSWDARLSLSQEPFTLRIILDPNLRGTKQKRKRYRTSHTKSSQCADLEYLRSASECPVCDLVVCDLMCE